MSRRGSAPSTHELRRAELELGSLIDVNAAERVFSDFFAAHPFVLSRSLPLKLRETEIITLGRAGRTEPDLVFYAQGAAPIYGVIELKRPGSRIVTNPRENVVALSRDAATAVLQCSAYLEDQNAELIQRVDRLLVLGTQSFAFIIMGLSDELAATATTEFARRQLQSQIPANCQLIPYDTLLERFAASVPLRTMVLSPSRLREEAPQLNVAYSLEHLIRVHGNEEAIRAATGLISAGGEGVSPIFLFGPTGVGKTHLMHATAHAMRGARPDARVAIWSAEQYTNELVAAIQRKTTSQFRDSIRSLDGFFVDNVESLKGKEAMQEELGILISELAGRGRSVMMAADRPPSQFPSIDRHLGELPGTQIVPVAGPDISHRQTIAQRKALAFADSDLAISSSVANLVAEHSHSIREIDAKLLKVRLFASLRGLPVTVAIAKEALKLTRPG
jgi:chromosomal replication initiation ATPase DnaA